MRVRIVRAGGRLTIRPDAGAIEPRLHIAPLPDTSTGALCVLLSCVISALRVSRPIQCKATAHKPFPEIGTADRTGPHRPTIWIEAERYAVDRSSADTGVEVVCRRRATAILKTVLAAAELAALRRVNSPETDALVAFIVSLGWLLIGRTVVPHGCDSSLVSALSRALGPFLWATSRHRDSTESTSTSLGANFALAGARFHSEAIFKFPVEGPSRDTAPFHLALAGAVSLVQENARHRGGLSD
ncbi:hypothetical protein M2222_002581 [Bradyrhizobium elkanii]|jgi:hypothetical protein|nr:hypothetical protein [Bradyrhizobium elkanii]MCS3560259.1 hypothetical protein [Bradyrhizobium elkanii]MCW2149895.1 hypothetical protein [Bradyrhizobium elkanii]MCW2360136.1 hypothetical protein [Bradyrhizobium elkanii]MCW2373626.1 hypothetical protein [Bradyrhizobium elkanii]